MLNSRWCILQNSFTLGDKAQRRGDFADAIRHYEYIIRNSETPEAEVYWRIALCTRGVEYVHEQNSDKWLPTITHMVMDSMLADENCRAAIHFARTEEMRRYYLGEAERIERILNRYRVVYSQEPKYDVFISVKQGDDMGRPTPDSRTARELYDALRRMGLRVFNSSISLAKHAGEDYEPYIMAALMSSKVMIVVGHSREYMDAPWVRNEWRRFRWLKENGSAGRRLIAYIVGMETGETPWELGEFQAINAKDDPDSMQTLSRTLEQVFPLNRRSTEAEQKNLLDRAVLRLRRGDFKGADEFCESVLSLNARNARAYVLKLCAELKICSEEALASRTASFADNGNYIDALECADPAYRNVLEGYCRSAQKNAAAQQTDKRDNVYRRPGGATGQTTAAGANRSGATGGQTTAAGANRSAATGQASAAGAGRSAAAGQAAAAGAGRSAATGQTTAAGAGRSAATGQKSHEAQQDEERCMQILKEGQELCNKQRYDEAYMVFMKASGHPVVQNYLGNLFLLGMGVTRNEEMAHEWFRLSAEQGNREAQYSLGQMKESGSGCRASEVEAAQWYEKAAKNGHPAAQLSIGRMYKQGRGVLRKDNTAAIWFMNSAKQGNVDAMLELGWMYERGRGVSKSDEEALNWYRQSANAGNRNAQFNVGLFFEKGRFVRQNDEEAAKWYRLSAEKGNPRAQYRLGLMYEEGRGVIRNALEAQRLIRLAAEQGDAAAKEHLKKY